MTPDVLPERLRRRIRIEAGHWRWTGSRNAAGYGLVHDPDRSRLAHREVWRALGLPLPEDLHHDGCPFKDCVNPACLRPLTKAEHTTLHAPERTGCVHGHEFTAANTYWRKDRNGRRSRQCRRCKADRQIERQRAGR